MNSDFLGEASDISLLPSQTVTGTVTGSGVDLQQFKGVIRAVLNTGVQAGTNTPTLQVYVQTSIDNNASNYANVSPAILFANITNANGNNVQISVGIDTRAVSRWVRILTGTSGTTPSFLAAVIGVGIKANY